MNIQKVLRGVTLSVMLVALVISVFSPAVYAATDSNCYGVVNVSRINVRSGAGLSYDVMYTLTEGDTVYLTGASVTADGYTWYEVSGGDEYYIADTGGWTLYNYTAYEDTITGYDAYGAVVWSHCCIGSAPDWSYHLEVLDEGYYIRCDCGWWQYRSIPTTYDQDFNPKLWFIGLDTDNDERVDLKPGQSKDLPCRADGTMRPYLILEFFDAPVEDIPSVTLCFHDADSNVIEEYTFYWWVNVHVEPYGIVMEGMNNKKVIHYVEGSFLLYSDIDKLFLGDEVRTYETNKQYNGKDAIIVKARHMTFYFQLEPPGEGALGPLEWVTHVVRGIGDLIADILDFFGLSFLFTDEASPFRFLMEG